MKNFIFIIVIILYLSLILDRTDAFIRPYSYNISNGKYIYPVIYQFGLHPDGVIDIEYKIDINNNNKQSGRLLSSSNGNMNDNTPTLLSWIPEPRSLAEAVKNEYDDTQLSSSLPYFILLSSQQWGVTYKDLISDAMKYTYNPNSPLSYLLAFSDICSIPSALRMQTITQAILQPINMTFTIREKDLYSLYIVQCNKDMIGKMNVTISGKITLKNPSHKGEGVHLSIDETDLIPLYTFLSPVYFVYFVIWVVVCCKAGVNTNVFHHLCTIAIFLKLLSLVLETAFYRMYAITGYHDSGLFLASEISKDFSVCSFLYVQVLLGFGWSFTRTQLTKREKLFIIFGFIFYLGSSIRSSICQDEAISKSQSIDDVCTAYVLLEYICKTIIMLAIIIATNFNLTLLRSSISYGNWTPSTATAYKCISIYESFRILFLFYLLLPTVLLILQLTILSWEYTWSISALDEFAMLGIYYHFGYLVSPKFSEGFNSFGKIANAIAGTVPLSGISNTNNNGDGDELDDEQEQEEADDSENENGRQTSFRFLRRKRQQPRASNQANGANNGSNENNHVVTIELRNIAP